MRWAVFGVLLSIVFWSAVLLLLTSCAAEEDVARRAVSAQGFKHVKLGLYPFFACGQSDVFNSEFTAYTARGKKIEGAVCCSIGNVCTVRIR